GSCNVAIFYYDTSEGRANCHLVHCPQPENCILRPQEGAVLFIVTVGVDPDLLVFDKLGHIDLNPRSSFKWERPNTSRALASPALLPTDQDPPPQSSHPQDPPPHPLSTGDHLPPATTPVSTSPVGASSLSGDDFREEPDSSHAGSMPPPKNQPPSDLPSPAHLDSSKQHFNETKGHSGRNQTSDGEGVGMGSASVGSWLLPVLLGSSVTFLCCCSGLLAFGCCKRRRGRYRPGREGNTGRRKLIMCTLLKEKV
ncbi:hypothetical protein FKM82_011755, partial [Ascaphus truei]